MIGGEKTDPEVEVKKKMMVLEAVEEDGLPMILAKRKKVAGDPKQVGEDPNQNQ